MKQRDTRKLHPVNGCELELNARPFDKFKVKVTTPGGKEMYYDTTKEARYYARHHKIIDKEQNT